MPGPRSPASSPPIPGPRALAVGLALLLTLTGLSPLAAAQTPPGATKEDPGFGLTSEQATYAPDEVVELILENTGEAVLTGDLELEIIWDGCSTTTCLGQPKVQHHAVHKGMTLAPGETTTLTWDPGQRDDTVSGGTYWAKATWTVEDGQREASSDPFELSSQEGSTDDAPSITVHHPTHGQVVTGQRLQLNLSITDPDGLARVVVELDGTQIVLDEQVHGTTFTYARTHELEPGPHVVTVEATDAAEAETSAATRVLFTTVLAAGTPALSLSADRTQAEPGQPIRIQLKNPGTAPLQGTPHLVVRDEAGGQVWGGAVTRGPATLAPGEHRSLLWDQVDHQGHPAAPGTYTLEATWGQETATRQLEIVTEAIGPRLDIQTPRPGAGFQTSLPLTLHLGTAGISELTVQVTGNTSSLERTHTYQPARTGALSLTLSLADLAPGGYGLQVTGHGPEGQAQATSWFRVVPDKDTRAPELTVLHPAPEGEVGLALPVVFQVEDDAGATYAEATLDGQLVGRNAWPQPVQRGALFARLPAGATGDQVLGITVYDAGDHAASVRVPVHVLAEARSCPQALMEAHRIAHASDLGPGAPVGTVPANASADAGLTFPCEHLRPQDTADHVQAGAFGYALDGQEAIKDVRVRGHQLFDTVATDQPTDASGDPGRITLLPGDRFMRLSATTGELTYQLNASWEATHQGEHVLLENQRDGSQVVMAVPDGTAQVRGYQVLTSGQRAGEVVVRPLGPSNLDRAIAHGILDGTVGAEVDLDATGQTDAVSYSDLTLSVEHEDGRLEALLSTPHHMGRTVAFTLAGDAFAQELVLTLDGQELAQADRIEDVLGAADPDEPSRYFVVHGQDTTTVLVQINHFSTRHLVLQAAEAVEGFLSPLAVLGALAVTVAAGVALFRRPAP